MGWLLKSSIAKKLIGSFLVVLVPITFISLLINYISMQIVQKEVTASYSDSVRLLSNQFYDNLEKFNSIGMSFSIDQELSALNQSPNTDTSILWDYLSLLKRVKLFSASSELNSDITIYLRNKEQLISSMKGISSINAYDSINIMDDRSNKIGKWFFRTIPGRKESVLSFIRPSSSDLSEKNIIVTIDIGEDQIRKMLGNLDVQENGGTFLLDSSGYGVFQNSPQGIDVEKLKDCIYAGGTSNGQFIYEQGSKKYRVILYSINNSQLLLGLCFPEDQIMKPIMRIRSWIFIILATSLVLAFFFTFTAYWNLLFPIHELIGAMQKVGAGDFKIRIPVKRDEEFGFMYKKFNQMVGQIDSLINEVYTERLYRQQTQLKLLQAQINPHFLYNCLNFIYHASMSENNMEAAQMSQFLGKYFRYATRVNRDSATLKEEFENVDAYLKIQQMRYPGKIEYELTIADEVREMVIPRLSVQPIVENAILHSLEKVGENRQIIIRGEQINSQVIITVEDDGKGIPPDKLEKINESFEDINAEGAGHGLGNTHWRLRLRYGESAGVHVETKCPGGTKVVLTIPPKERSRGTGSTHYGIL